MSTKNAHLHRQPKEREKRDEPVNEQGRSAYLDLRDERPEIHLHDGAMRLFICGHVGQPDAWFPVTAPSSAPGPHGTAVERAIAEETVKWLRLHHSSTPGLDPATIRKALEAHGWKPDWLTQYAA